MEVVLEARNITKQDPDKNKVEGINFSIKKNECYGLVGPVGSGKSTLISILSGTMHMTSGDYFVEGMNGRKNERTMRRKIGVMPKYSLVDSDLCVIDNLILYGRYFGLSYKNAVAKARDLLRFIGLEQADNQSVEPLTRFERRKLLFAMSLMNSAEILFLDEPTVELTGAEATWFWNAIDTLKLNGMTILLSTRQMFEAERLCDRILIINEGQCLLEGVPAALIEENIGYEVVEFRVDLADLEYHLKKIRDRFKYQVLHNTIRLFLDQPDEAKRALDLVASDSIQVRRATLHDVFLKVAGYDINTSRM